MCNLVSNQTGRTGDQVDLSAATGPCVPSKSEEAPTLATHLEAVTRLIDYRFQNTELLMRALIRESTHPRYPSDFYETYEYLGDRVLGLCAADIVASKYPFTLTPEMVSTTYHNINSNKFLAELPVVNELNEMLLKVTAEGDAAVLHPETGKAVADTAEAVLGAAFLDGGLAAATKVLLRMYGESLPELRSDFKGAEIIPTGAEEEFSQRLDRTLGISIGNAYLTFPIYLASTGVGMRRHFGSLTRPNHLLQLHVLGLKTLSLELAERVVPRNEAAAPSEMQKALNEQWNATVSGTINTIRSHAHLCGGKHLGLAVVGAMYLHYGYRETVELLKNIRERPVEAPPYLPPPPHSPSPSSPVVTRAPIVPPTPDEPEQELVQEQDEMTEAHIERVLGIDEQLLDAKDGLTELLKGYVSGKVIYQTDLQNRSQGRKIWVSRLKISRSTVGMGTSEDTSEAAEQAAAREAIKMIQSGKFHLPLRW